MIKKRRTAVSGAFAEAIEQRLLMSTYTVNTLSDALAPVPNQLTLRQAVSDANSNAGADAIAFDPKVFAAGSLHSIALTNGPIKFTDMTGGTTINGPGSSVLAVDGGKRSRVFQISSGVTVSIGGLTITDGAVNTSAGVLATGGGVQNAGMLTLTDVTVSNNTVTLASATMSDPFGLVPADADGGGIYSTGTLSLLNCTITGNRSWGGSSYGMQAANGSSYGGGIYSTGSLTIAGSTVSDNSATGGSSPTESTTGGNASGGGVYTTASFSMTSSTVSGNIAAGGTALQTEGGGSLGGAAYGGGIFATSDSAITGSSFTDNHANAGYSDQGGDLSVPAPAWGGGIFSTGSLTIDSSTFTKDQAMGGGRPANDNGPGGNAYGGAIAAEGALTITGSTLSSNSALGGAASETTGGPAAAKNSSDFGGAVYSAKSLMLLSSTVSGNIAQADQVDDLYGGGSGYSQGGGIFVTGTATIEASTLNGNIAQGGLGLGTGGTGGAGEGAGVFNGGTLTLTNSTIVNNQSEGGTGGDGATANGGGGNAGNGGDGIGAGIYTTGTLRIYNGTVTSNTTSGGGPGQGGEPGNPNGAAGTGLAAGVAIASGTAVFSNTIISANTANGSAPDDISGSANSSSARNLIGVGGGLTNGVNGNQVGVTDPKLASLTNNGGPTQTILPLAGSPVIDAGANSLVPTGITTDQRGAGFPRIFNGTIDIGAVEYGGIIVMPPPDQSAIAGQSAPVSLGSFSVSDASGPFTVETDWGDGSTGNFSAASAGAIPAQPHTYRAAGNETATISVVDSSGDVSGGRTFHIAVAAAPANASAVNVLASTYLAVPGSLITLTAGVVGTTSAVPAGTVTFSSNGSVLGTANLINGMAMLATSSLSAGSHGIIASYGGNTEYSASSSSPITVTIQEPSQITPAFARANLPVSVIAGARMNAKLSLLLTNMATTSKGTFTINYYVNQVAGLDGNQILLTSVARKFSLKSEKHAAISTVIKSLPPTLPAGTYYLLAEVLDPLGLASVAVISKTVAVVAPFVDLSASVGSVSPAILTIRRTGAINITITNHGNIVASGLVDITVYPSVDAVPQMLEALAKFIRKTTIGAGQTRRIKLRVRVPSTLGIGSYIPDSIIMLNGQTVTAAGSTPFSAR